MKPHLAPEKNGLDISPTYDNDARYAELVSTIAKDLQDWGAVWAPQDSDLIRISTEGPELELFDPSTATTRWLKSGKRKPFAKEWNAGEVMTESPKQETGGFFVCFFCEWLAELVKLAGK